jgi:hypothetical protein
MPKNFRTVYSRNFLKKGMFLPGSRLKARQEKGAYYPDLKFK